jgi:histone-lysine N-methyltransferase SETD7
LPTCYSYVYIRESGIRYIHYVGRNDGPVQQADITDRSVVTVVNEAARPPMAWQWVSRYKMDGILYGPLDVAGRLTGPNITFVYPDFRTGLYGTFDNGRLVAGIAVRITGFRCRHGLMEIRTRPLGPGGVWRRETYPGEYLRANAQRMDPFDRRAVYIATSHIPGANEGVFAKRDFLPGQLVSYFVGQQTKEANFIFDNQTSSEYEEARAYYFNLGSHSPAVWGLAKDVVLDMPKDMRTLATFRTTLAHKTNHKVRRRFFTFYFGSIYSTYIGEYRKYGTNKFTTNYILSMPIK